MVYFPLPFDLPLQALFKGHAGLVIQLALGARDVGSSMAVIAGRTRLVLDTRRRLQDAAQESEGIVQLDA